MNNVIHMNKLCHACERRDVICPSHTHEWVMSQVWISHVSHIKESHHTCERVVSHIIMSQLRMQKGNSPQSGGKIIRLVVIATSQKVKSCLAYGWVTHTHVDKQNSKRTKHTSVNTQHGSATHTQNRNELSYLFDCFFIYLIVYVICWNCYYFMCLSSIVWI